MSSERVAVVTGGNKGIGYAICKALCKQFDGVVYLTSRNEALGLKAVDDFKSEGLNPKYHQLDIDSLESIQRFRDFIESTHGGIDVLVNNAGIYIKRSSPASVGERAELTNKTNFFGTLNVCNELFPLLRKHSRIVNVSSSRGHLLKINGQEPHASVLREQFADPELTTNKLIQLVKDFITHAKQGTHFENGWPTSAYSVSKVAVSALTRIQQREFDKTRSNDDIVVNSVHPGFVDTDLTSHKGKLTIHEGAVGPVWLALLPPNVNEPRGAYVSGECVTEWVK